MCARARRLVIHEAYKIAQRALQISTLVSKNIATRTKFKNINEVLWLKEQRKAKSRTPQFFRNKDELQFCIILTTTIF